MNSDQQINSDTIYVKIASDSTGKGSVPQDCPTSDSSSKPRLSPVLLIDLLEIRSSHSPSIGFD